MIVQFTPSDLEAIRMIVREEIMNQSKKEELFTRSELCERLGISKSTLHRHIRNGDLKVESVGRKLKIK